jgi:hypothetical protein
VVVHICNLSSQETETEESRVLVQPGLCSETMSQKKNHLEG